jgi:hypothetical protein
VSRLFTVLGLALLLGTNLCYAGTSFTGVFGADGDVQSFSLQISSDSTVSVLSLGYGGWVAPSVPSGGFATSLALYDAFGNQLAHDFVGGTAIGSSCSNGATQDPTTGFCEDATLSFFALAGSYTLTLSEQGNDGPDPLNSGFPLAPGTINAGGPFVDPGYPGILQRTGSWALDVTINGTASELTGTPEPATWLLMMAGLGAVLRRRGASQEGVQ